MIVAVGQQKGGVGKSTLCISLAVEAHLRGLRTLLVDGDLQRTALVWAEVAAEAKTQVPAVIGMAGAMHRPEQLPTVAAAYDFVLIDLPPRNDAVTRSALMVADLVLLPSSGSPQDVWALGDTLRLVEDAKILRPTLPAAIVITRATNTTMGKAARAVLEGPGLPVLRASLGFRVTYSEAIAAGLGPTTYAPSSEAADETRRLLSEVLALGAPVHGKAKARRRVPQHASR